MVKATLQTAKKYLKGELHLAIGIFDGVHLGHQALLNEAIKNAKEATGTSGLLTFWPHPSHVLSPENAIPMLMPLDLKTKILSQYPLDLFIVEPFTPEVAATSAENFIDQLINTLPKLKGIYVGENFKFGRKRQGDVSLLKKIGQIKNFNVFDLKPLQYSGKMISSSRIRKELLAGNLEAVNAMLGGSYSCKAKVINHQNESSGDAFSTYTLSLETELVPKEGSYLICAFKERKEKVFEGTLSLKSDTEYATLQFSASTAHPSWKLNDSLTLSWLGD